MWLKVHTPNLAAFNANVFIFVVSDGLTASEIAFDESPVNLDPVWVLWTDVFFFFFFAPVCTE